jgi:hypothetical protein
MTTSFRTICAWFNNVRGGSLQLLSDPGALLIPSAELDTELYKLANVFWLRTFLWNSTGALPGKFMAVNVVL